MQRLSQPLSCHLNVSCLMNFPHLACRIPFCVFCLPYWFCPSVSFTSLFSSVCPLMFQQKVPGLGLSSFEQVFQGSWFRKPRLFRNIKIFWGNYLSILTQNLSFKTFLLPKSLNQVSTNSLPSSSLVNPSVYKCSLSSQGPPFH